MKHLKTIAIATLLAIATAQPPALGYQGSIEDQAKRQIVPLDEHPDFLIFEIDHLYQVEGIVQKLLEKGVTMDYHGTDENEAHKMCDATGVLIIYKGELLNRWPCKL